MSSPVNQPDFDEIADIFWRLGVMSSPAQLQGYLLGLLAVGHELKEPEWLQLAAAFIDPVEPPAEVEQQSFLELLQLARGQLETGGMELQLLLPEQENEIVQRVDSLSQWCKGFLAGFAQGGQQRKAQQGELKYPEDVSETLTDIANISQAALGEGDEDEQEREKSFFEIAEYLRLAVINIYLECQQLIKLADNKATQKKEAPPPPADQLH